MQEANYACEHCHALFSVPSDSTAAAALACKACGAQAKLLESPEPRSDGPVATPRKPAAQEAGAEALVIVALVWPFAVAAIAAGTLGHPGRSLMMLLGFLSLVGVPIAGFAVSRNFWLGAIALLLNSMTALYGIFVLFFAAMYAG